MCIGRRAETVVNPLDAIRIAQLFPRPITPIPRPRTRVEIQQDLNNLDFVLRPYTLHRSVCLCALLPKVEPPQRTGPVMFTARLIIVISFALVVAKLITDHVISADALSTDNSVAFANAYAEDASSTDDSVAVANVHAENTLSTDNSVAVSNVYAPSPQKKVQDGHCAGKVKRQLPPLEQGNQVIDSIFQIPIGTLNAVGSLIKNARPLVRRTRERIQQYYINQQRPNRFSRQDLQQYSDGSKPTSVEESMYTYSDLPYYIIHTDKDKMLEEQRDDLKIEGRLHRQEYMEDY